MKTVSLILILFLAAVPLAAQSASISPESGTSCAEVSLSEEAQPGYTISGSWISPKELVLVDALNNRLVRIDPAGRFIGPQGRDIEARVKADFKENFLPVSIQPANGGAWLELVGGRLARLSSAAQIDKTRDLWGTPVGKDATLIAILGWTATGEDVFGYGNFDMPDGSVKTGFFRLGLNQSEGVGMLTPLPKTQTTQLWYRLGIPFVASIGDVGYALSMENGRLSIVESRPGEQELRRVGSLTGPLSQLPALSEFNTPDDFRVIMNKLSSSSTPMGLYGWKGKLYLLWKYHHQDQYSWFLSRIDPDTRELEATAVIPSSAAHLMAIPGPTQWAFVEKGPVKGYMTQEVGSALFVSAPAVSSFSHSQNLCRTRL